VRNLKFPNELSGFNTEKL